MEGAYTHFKYSIYCIEVLGPICALFLEQEKSQFVKFPWGLRGLKKVVHISIGMFPQGRGTKAFFWGGGGVDEDNHRRRWKLW